MKLQDAGEARLQALVNEFEQSGGQILDDLGRSIERREVPPTLYHYTDALGLQGILTRGRFWFTNLFQLNDPSELKHGIDHAKNLIGVAARRSGNPELMLSANIFTSTVSHAVESSAHYFVCCFSQNGDDLNQWRSYADNGRGYALAFDRAKLDAAFSEVAKEHHSAFPITYDDKHLCEMHTKLIENWTPYVSSPRGISGLTGEKVAAYQGDLAVQLALQIFQTSMHYKHEAYRTEQEYRFLQLFSAKKEVPGLLTRDRNGLAVSYREFDWKVHAADALQKIVIGPAADKAKAADFAYECLKGYEPPSGIVGFSASEIPYRS